MSDVRLIDANRFKRFLQALCKAGAPYDDVIQLLDKEPTAYNPEKVVEELEKRAEDNLIVANRLQGIEPKRKICEWKGRAGGFKTAIDIVKRGGVE